MLVFRFFNFFIFFVFFVSGGGMMELDFEFDQNGNKFHLSSLQILNSRSHNFGFHLVPIVTPPKLSPRPYAALG